VGLLNILTGPITGLINAIGGKGGVIDNLTTTQQEKDAAKIELYKLQTSFLNQMEAAATEFAKQQAEVIIAEAKGESPLQRNWRPILMLTFTAIIAWQYLLYPILSGFFPQLTQLAIAPEMWELLKIGVGGYIVGRSAEKMMDSYSEGKKIEVGK
jgi:hypothetical protein